jgi:hypothetical protein
VYAHADTEPAHQARFCTAVGYVCNNMLWNYAAGLDVRWGGWNAALDELITD